MAFDIHSRGIGEITRIKQARDKKGMKKKKKPNVFTTHQTTVKEASGTSENHETHPPLLGVQCLHPHLPLPHPLL